MIRLTDKEISPFVEVMQEEAKVDIDGLLKAQLKKVVEWGDEDCFDHNGARRREQGWHIKRRVCPECWQTLLEEVKE